VSWLKKKPELPRAYPKREMPDNIWTKCDGCGEIIYRRELERNLFVCQKCGHHFRIPARTVMRFLIDPDTFEERFSNITSTDPLEFRDSKKYVDRLKSARQSSGATEAVLCGKGAIEGHPVAIGLMDFSFLGGSMASAVGERLARLMKLALAERTPLIIVSSSGGARMQEGILSLMQMAKTSALLARLADAGVPYISVLTHPTTGGVTASFASLGDIILAEPKALIGFAGPRVIEQTINQELPPGFQRSEFLLDHGFVDRIVPRAEMRATLAQILGYFADSGGNGPSRGAASAVSRAAAPARPAPPRAEAPPAASAFAPPPANGSDTDRGDGRPASRDDAARAHPAPAPDRAPAPARTPPAPGGNTPANEREPVRTAARRVDAQDDRSSAPRLWYDPSDADDPFVEEDEPPRPG